LAEKVAGYYHIVEESVKALSNQ